MLESALPVVVWTIRVVLIFQGLFLVQLNFATKLKFDIVGKAISNNAANSCVVYDRSALTIARDVHKPRVQD